jgi:hypothetical protein
MALSNPRATRVGTDGPECRSAGGAALLKRLFQPPIAVRMSLRLMSGVASTCQGREKP